MRQGLTELAQTWNRLAAEIESDEALFQAISEIELGEPYQALPRALKSSPKRVAKHQRIWRGSAKQTVLSPNRVSAGGG